MITMSGSSARSGPRSAESGARFDCCRATAASGKSESGSTPTTNSPRPSAKSVSVCVGDTDTMRPMSEGAGNGTGATVVVVAAGAGGASGPSGSMGGSVVVVGIWPSSVAMMTSSSSSTAVPGTGGAVPSGFDGSNNESASTVVVGAGPSLDSGAESSLPEHAARTTNATATSRRAGPLYRWVARSCPSVLDRRRCSAMLLTVPISARSGLGTRTSSTGKSRRSVVAVLRSARDHTQSCTTLVNVSSRRSLP